MNRRMGTGTSRAPLAAGVMLALATSVAHAQAAGKIDDPGGSEKPNAKKAEGFDKAKASGGNKPNAKKADGYNFEKASSSRGTTSPPDNSHAAGRGSGNKSPHSATIDAKFANRTWSPPKSTDRNAVRNRNAGSSHSSG